MEQQVERIKSCQGLRQGCADLYRWDLPQTWAPAVLTFDQCHSAHPVRRFSTTIPEAASLSMAASSKPCSRNTSCACCENLGGIDLRLAGVRDRRTGVRMPLYQSFSMIEPRALTCSPSRTCLVSSTGPHGRPALRRSSEKLTPSTSASLAFKTSFSASRLF